MDTDPNPFRESPDSDRSASATEAPSDTQDVAEVSEEPTGGSSAMSEDEEEEKS